MFSRADMIQDPPEPVDLEEFRQRQSRILGQLETTDLLIIPANPKAVRSNDVEYPYRNNSDMIYLCGWQEENSVLIARWEGGWRIELFVQPRNILMEIWHGRRPGVEGAEANWPIDSAHSIEDLEEELSKHISECNRVLMKTGLNDRLDTLVIKAFERKDRARQLLGKGPMRIEDPSQRIAECRLRKSESEIEQMRHASQVSAAAHVAAMKWAWDGIGEGQLQSIIEGFFQWNGQTWSYPSIVGFGENATILHYHENDSPCLGEGIVLIDAGSEYRGYSADITRSWPTSGNFTEPQKEIYEVVLEAQKKAIEACVVGAPYDAPHQAARQELAKGLIKLGVIDSNLETALSEEGELRRWYMHNTGHWIGLDVHDVGVYRPDGEPRLLEEGMVMTVEPGLYFGAWRDDVEVPVRYADIGIRIEDDVLITAEGPDVLTRDCPKEIDELENLIGSAHRGIA